MRELPGRPILEQLEMQAKELLRAQQAGDGDVCDALRWLSRFAGRSSEEILGAEVTLAEAREATAIEYGFHGWDALREYVVSLGEGSDESADWVPDHILERWQASIDAIARVASIPAALVMRVVSEDIEVFLASRGEANPYRPGDKEHLLGSGLYCETVLKTRKQLLVPDALSDPDWAANPDIKLGMISYLGLPLLLPEGETFGTICVLDSEPNSYSEDVLALLASARAMIEAHLELLATNRRLVFKNASLRSALEQVRDLKRLLPICSHCSKIKTSRGNWLALDEYYDEEGVQLTHGVCPSCMSQHWGSGS